MMPPRRFTLFVPIIQSIFSISQVYAGSESHGRIELSFSPFDSALETLQKHIGYNFTNIGLLRRAMTHASFSEENNKALSIMGESIMETSVALRLLQKDADISTKDLNRQIQEVSSVDSCAVDGKRLGLQKIVRISPKTDPSNSAILCGGFRAIFGAIAVDTGMIDDAIRVFWNVHGGQSGKAVSL